MGISNVASNFRPGICTSTTRPTTPFEGQVIYETDTNQTLVYDGAAWVMVHDLDTPPGMVLVKTQTIGTTVSSVTVSSAFSADYDVYKIVISGGAASTTTRLDLTLGSTTSGYYTAGTFRQFAGTSTTLLYVDDENVAYWYAGETNTNSHSFDVTLINPYLSKVTSFEGYLFPARTDGYLGSVGGFLNNTTSYTAFTITPASGTLTGGTIRVYGYRNS